jgi:hypothetical protein
MLQKNVHLLVDGADIDLAGLSCCANGGGDKGHNIAEGISRPIQLVWDANRIDICLIVLNGHILYTTI